MTMFRTFRINPSLRLALIFVLLGVTYANVHAQQTLNEIDKANIPAFNQASNTLYTSAQPSKDALEIIAKHGVKHVINLRPASEQDWDEQAWVESLGMTYHSIPVAGAKGITFENAAKLHDLLSELEQQPTLLHCSSSNRVGGLRALIEFRANGGQVEAAIEAGKKWGLTGLEDMVRTQLSSSAK